MSICHVYSVLENGKVEMNAQAKIKMENNVKFVQLRRCVFVEL